MPLALELSDAIKLIEDTFGEYVAAKRTFKISEIQAIHQGFKLLFDEARRLENENSRLRWNEEARKEREQCLTEAALAEAARSNGKIVILSTCIQTPTADTDAVR